MMVDYLLLGSDARQEALARLLTGQFHVQRLDDTETKEVPSVENLVLPIPSAWPDGRPRGADWETLETLLAPGVTVYGGAFGPLAEELEAEGARCVDLLAQPETVAENARLTAEAALLLAMQHTQQSLFGKRCCVIGLGRIGTLLCRLLAAHGAKVCAVSTGVEKRALAQEQGIAAAAPDDLPAQRPDLIFNTAPACLVTKETLATLPPATLWIELASQPGGLPAGEKPPIVRLPASGLPARFLPVSAAQVLYDAISRDRKGGVD